MLNRATDRNFAGSSRLAPAVALTLDGLSAHATLHLLCEESLLLVKVRSRVLHIQVLEVVSLISARSFS